MNSSHPDRKTPARRISVAIRLGLAALAGLAGAGIGATGCLERPLCSDDCQPRTTNIFVDAISQKSVDKIDLLFLIDNSSSMADKQEVLKAAVPDLAKRLVSPQCVDSVTGIRRGATPEDPAAPCEDGAIREFDAIKNIHIGVITSSLGGHGSGTCEPRERATAERVEMEDDRAELVGSRPRFNGLRSGGGQNPTAEGFLDWNPVVMAGQPIGPFNITFQDMTTAAGEYGCGFEAQLESIYRFLVDPAPPTEIILQPNGAASFAVSGGTNQTVLTQRAAFLRPDSLVAIVMLTDENDCSIRDSGQNYFAARQDIPPLGASSACETDANAACCYSCLEPPPSGCTADAACSNIDEFSDPPNLRCFEQQRRFGIDFLYPTQRYVNALKNPEICPDSPNADLDCANGGTRTANPLFVNPTGLPRDPSLVFLAGIVGVPWQDLKATTITDAEDTEIPVPDTDLRYIKTSDPRMAEVWPVILGLPGAPARDALMQENIFPRGGDGPIEPGIGRTGQIMPPGSGPLANPANGHEYASSRGEDLQYACIFKLAQPRDCVQFDPPPPVPGAPVVDRAFCDCDAVAVSDQNPLCQADNGSYSRVQVYGKAYPTLRELQVLKDFGNQSIVASICARNLTDPNRQDYGYRPAVDAIIDRLKDALTGRCLPRRLEPDADGNVPCSVIEAVQAGTCDPARGRTPAAAKLQGPARVRLEQQGVCGKTGQPACSSFTLCELGRAEPACLEDVPYAGVAGWCYVDPEQGLGVESLVANCKNANEKRLIRFVDPDKQTPAPGSRVLIACFGADLED